MDNFPKLPKNIRKKYNCEICDYNASYYKDLVKHQTTLKHKNKQLEIDGNEKIQAKSAYHCQCCNYKTTHKNDFIKHENSKKHILKNQGLDEKTIHKCSSCNKEYLNYSGLWKHKKQCNIIKMEQPNEIENTFIPSNNINANIFLEVLKESKELQQVLIEQNKELQNKLLEQNSKLLERETELQNKLLEQNKEHHQEIIELASKQSSNTNINSHNKTNNFNLQFFLNETCKDAMNIADFVNSLQLTTDDFETTGKLGFVDGISRIFIKELKKIDTEKLPIHCTDFKRETVYIKDNNTWEKENDEKKRVKWAIDKIAKLNYNQIQQWQEKFPECRENNTPANEYFFRLVKVALGGYGKEEENKFRDKIMRNVLKEVVIDKK